MNGAPPSSVVPVLLYHRVASDPDARIAPYTVTPDVFARHLELASALGRTTITVSAFASSMQGHRRLPASPLVITFDDGYRDTADVAAPMLAAHGFVATVFVTTGLLAGSPAPAPRRPLGPMLHWDQMGELEAAGLEIGPHSHSHPQLDLLPPPQSREEVGLSRLLLEDALGHAVSTFAYPHGCASPAVQATVRAAGFDAACGVRNRLSWTGDNRFLIARLTVGSGTPEAVVASWLRGAGARVAPQRELLRTAAWRRARRLRTHLPGGAIR